MNLVKFAEPVSVGFKKSAGGASITFEAMRDYVIASNQLDRITQDENVRNRLYKCSKLEPRLVPFHILARKQGTQRLLFYNGSGGYGDQIMSWPVARWLAMQGFDVHVLTDPGNQPCWYNFPFVKTVNVSPLPFEQFKLYDYHFVMEHVINLDEHQDQLHPVDTMFVHMGVDPTSIDPKLKVVHPVFTWAELNYVNNFSEYPHIGFFQLASANGVRAMTPSDSAFLALKMAEEFPEIHWLCLYDEFIPPTYVDALKCRTCGGAGNVVWSTGTCHPGDINQAMPIPKLEGAVTTDITCPDCGGSKYLTKNIQPIVFQNLRELWALVHKRAAICVGPDSMLVHLAGSMGIPCVGIWGPISPTNRVAYYSGHHAIWKREACPHAPCFSYLAGFPRYCPPRGAARQVCEVVAAATPTEVIEAIHKIKR